MCEEVFGIFRRTNQSIQKMKNIYFNSMSGVSFKKESYNHFICCGDNRITKNLKCVDYYTVGHIYYKMRKI